MGKQVPKSKSSKEDEMDEYDSQIDELYRPFLIHSTTYALLTEQILSLMPSERNVLLTMNEYDLSEINPMHPNTVDSPTHVIIFCIRFVAGDTFQPIGGLLIYKYKDQSLILAECLKAYINDLWKLGLYVIGTVSPPFESFKGMLSHLVDVKDFNTFSDSLVYSVSPIKEIVHIYDIQFLLIKLQNLFKEGDIKFEEGSREYRATWNDILLVLNLSSEFKILSNYLSDNKDVSRRVHIFTQQIFEQLLELEAQGVLSKNAGGSAVLLNCIRSFLQFTELDLVNLKQMCLIDGWDNFTSILPSMTFQKSKKRTCTKTKPTMAHVIANPTVRRKIDFHGDEDADIIENLAENLDGIALREEQEENFEDECDVAEDSKRNQTSRKDCKKGHGKTGKQKKGKVKNSKEAKTDETKMKLHCKKPYEKQRTGKTNISKKTNTSQNQKTDFENNTNNNTIKENSNAVADSLGDKVSGETEDFSDVSREKANAEELDNKINFNCDRDKNNNSDESLQASDNLKKKGTSPDGKCDAKTTINNKKNETNFKAENFDLVINDPQRFFESFFMGCNANAFDTGAESNTLQNTEGDTNTSDLPDQDTSPNESNGTDANKENSAPESYDDFCSQSDEDTESCVTRICDKVPTIVESLGNEEGKENLPDEFENNDVTYELLSTVFGMKRLMENLIGRRVRIAKPDAFVVEHIDFLVTIIKRDKNRINPVYYYGHNYGFLNAELAFSTLQNNKGLFLVKT